MKCPRCVQKIHRGAESCPHCGFALPHAAEDFSPVDPVVNALSDRAGLMRRIERERVQHAIDRFAARFPQLVFCVHTAVFSDVSHLRSFGFWLVNHGIFEDYPDRKNASAIVLVIDVARKAAGLSYGYHLEPYLDEALTFDCLCKAHPHWLEGKHDVGIIAVIKALTATLERASRQAAKQPEKFAKKVMASAQTEALAQRIRGHGASRESQSEEVSEVES